MSDATTSSGSTGAAPRVGVVMGSESDLAVMRAACEVLARAGIPFETRVTSAHRSPRAMLSYGETAAERGLEVLIAGAGGAAHLPGMLASVTPLPVIGVPVAVGALSGVDALLSIAQMPGGVPVATVAVGGARNAAMLALRILGVADLAAREVVEAQRRELEERAREQDQRVREATGAGSG